MSKAKPDPHADALAALLDAIGDPAPEPEPLIECPEDEDPGVHQLVYSMLLWNATHAKAAKAVRSLLGVYADYNDLRADLPGEVASAMGGRYPRAEERAARMLAALNAVFERFHVTSLAPLADFSKRELRTYLDELPGLPGFVSARVALAHFGAHAAPVDDDTCAALTEAGVLEPGTNADDACAKLERLVRAADGMDVHQKLEAWRTAGLAQPKRSTKPKKQPARTSK